MRQLVFMLVLSVAWAAGCSDDVTTETVDGSDGGNVALDVSLDAGLDGELDGGLPGGLDGGLFDVGAVVDAQRWGDAADVAGMVDVARAGRADAGTCKNTSLPVGCCITSPFVWPTTGTASQTLISATYGSREQFSAGGAYDWHQGIDLPGHDKDDGFNDPMYAVADGEIYRIGNLPGDDKGAIANFSEKSGNVIVLEHADADTGLGQGDIYSLYLHVAAMKLSAFSARLAGSLTVIDLTEYYFLDGADTKSSNRGKPRKNFKTSGQSITAHPRFRRGDAMAMIGDSGSSIDYEHLHFELRDRAEPATSPSGFNREWARNPYAYLPHPNLSSHTAQITNNGGGKITVTVSSDRDGVARGEPITGVQDLDLERVRLEIRAGATVVDSREFRFFEDINLAGTEKFSDGKLGFDHDDFLSNAHAGAAGGEPDRSLGGVNVRLEPAKFTSFIDTWKLVVEFSALAGAKFVPSSGQNYAVTVYDVCGNAATAALPAVK